MDEKWNHIDSISCLQGQAQSTNNREIFTAFWRIVPFGAYYVRWLSCTSVGQPPSLMSPSNAKGIRMSPPNGRETDRVAAPRRTPPVPPEHDLFEFFDPLKGHKLEILDPQGVLVGERWLPDLSPEKLVAAYQVMVLARVADTRAVSLQRQGRLFTLPPSSGQEACAVGSAMALESGDWIAPAYRELGALLYKGVPLSRIYTYHSGSEQGNVYPLETHVLPSSVPIASQLLHAAGIAHAISYRSGREVAITYFGDGGTSEGDFHEALNWAGVFNLPVIFFCNNNQYAISYPRAQQTKSRTIAQKAIAYGMPGIQVDGNDLLAVYRATKEAVDRARAGRGPTLIEAETYRITAHTTSDDPSRYRTSEEEELWKSRDPLDRVRKYLESKKLWDDAREAEAREAATRQCDEAFREAEKQPVNTPEEIVSNVFETVPPELQQQLRSLKDYLTWKEGR
jgi:pyruvate dehydrogenase E1 component alpha subunit